jgi:Fungal specific transcription factor domain
MHRKPHKRWGVGEQEMQERSRLFWVIYWLDKTISLRSGRPSVSFSTRESTTPCRLIRLPMQNIDDDDIDCPFPKLIPRDPADIQNGENFDYLLCLARYARICSRIMKQLYLANALSKHPFTLISRINALEEELDNWRQTIPASFRPAAHLQASKLPHKVPFIQALTLHFSYHYAMCTIHRRILWAQRLHQQPITLPGHQVSKAVEHATDITVQSARTMILLTKDISITSYTPSW